MNFNQHELASARLEMWKLELQHAKETGQHSNAIIAEQEIKKLANASK